MLVVKLGAGTDTAHVLAPSVEDAVWHYIKRRTGGDFCLVVIYTVDGEEWNGDSWWVKMFFEESYFEANRPRLTASIEAYGKVEDQCRFLMPFEYEKHIVRVTRLPQDMPKEVGYPSMSEAEEAFESHAHLCQGLFNGAIEIIIREKGQDDKVVRRQEITCRIT